MTAPRTPEGAVTDTVFALLAARAPGTVLPPLTLAQTIPQFTALVTQEGGRSVEAWLNLRPLAVRLVTAQTGVWPPVHVWAAPFDLEWVVIGPGPEAGASSSARRNRHQAGLLELSSLMGVLPRRIALPDGHPAGSFYDLDMTTGTPLATQDETGVLALLPNIEAATWRLTATFVAASPLRAAS